MEKEGAVKLESTEFAWLEPLYIDTDKRDSKGRTIGYRVRIFSQVFVPTQSLCFALEDSKIGRVAGQRYGAIGQQTRNGKHYLAGVYSRYFDTEAQARDWALAKLTTFMIKHGVNYVRPAA